MKATLALALVACGGAHTPITPPSPPTFPETCVSIARAIENLGDRYPQLATFDASKQRDCQVSFGFHTHRSTTRGGWSSSVPHPDDDGVWFHIGIYDPNGPDADSQINTQPVVPNWWIGDRKVMFLILEGEHTTKASSAILKILEQHGMQTR